MGDAKGFHSLKEGVHKVLPCLERGGGGLNKFWTFPFSHFVAPLPITNDHSLNNMARQTCLCGSIVCKFRTKYKPRKLA